MSSGNRERAAGSIHNPRGAMGSMLAVNQGGVILEADGKIGLVKARHIDHLTVCPPRTLSVLGIGCNSKANWKATRGSSATLRGEARTTTNDGDSDDMTKSS